MSDLTAERIAEIRGYLTPYDPGLNWQYRYLWDVPALLAALEAMTKERDELRAERDAYKAAIDRVRTVVENVGPCSCYNDGQSDHLNDISQCLVYDILLTLAPKADDGGSK